MGVIVGSPAYFAQRATDAPVERVLTGGRGALAKELVSRATLRGVRAEARHGFAVTRWQRTIPASSWPAPAPPARDRRVA
jgi:hypothetical protein